MKGVELNYGNIVKFGTKVYEAVNGWINPLLPASGIEFDYENLAMPIPSKEQISFNAFMAYTVGSRVFFNPNVVVLFQRYVYEAYSGEHLAPMFIKGLIADVMIHELSHLNQEIDQYRYDYDKEYNAIIESANELYSKAWIKEHYRELEELIGGFDIIPETPYNDVKAVTIKDYKPIKSVRNRMVSLMKSLFQADVLNLVIDYAKEYPVVHFFINDAKKGKLLEIKSDDFINSDSAAKKIMLFLENGIYLSGHKGINVEIVLLTNGIIEFYIEYVYSPDLTDDGIGLTIYELAYCGKSKKYCLNTK